MKDRYSLNPHVTSTPLIPSKTRRKSQATTEIELALYVMDISYFSGKVESYLCHREFRVRRIEPTLKHLAQLKRITGTSQVPIVYDCRETTSDERRWLRDSTSIIEHFEKERGGGSRIMLSSASPDLRFLAHLLEEYADEGMWRPAMYMRWNPEFDRFSMSNRWTYEFGREHPFPMNWLVPSFAWPHLFATRQWLYSVFGEGISSHAQHWAVQNYFFRTSAVMEAILSKRAFLMSDATPTIVDFGFMGPYWRHFASDPTPRKILEQKYPNVIAWVYRVLSSRESRCATSASPPLAPEEEIFEDFRPLFPLLREFIEYSNKNAESFQTRKSEFEFSFLGVPSLVPVVEFRVWSRGRLQERAKECGLYDDSSRPSTNGNNNGNNGIERRNWKGGLEDLPTLIALRGKVRVEPELGCEPPFVLSEEERARREGGGWRAWLRGLDAESPKWDRWPLYKRHIMSFL